MTITVVVTATTAIAIHHMIIHLIMTLMIAHIMESTAEIKAQKLLNQPTQVPVLLLFHSSLL